MFGSAAILGIGSVTSWILVAAILLVTYYFLVYSRHPSNYPPIPCRPLPIVGHAFLLGKNPTDVLMAWRKKLGSVFGFYVGSQLHVCLSSSAMLKEALIKQADAFSQRPPSFAMEIFSGDKNGKIIGIGGPHWREHRNLTLIILRDFGMGKNLLSKKIDEEVDCYLKALADFQGKPVPNIKPLTESAVCNVIISIIVGHRFEYDDKDYIKLTTMLSLRMNLMAFASLLNVWPWLAKLPGDLFNAKKVKALNKEMFTSYYEKFIEAAEKDLQKSDTKDSYIKAYLTEMHKRQAAENTDTDLDVECLRSMIDELVTGGSETTSTTLQWSMVYAMNYPDVIKKVYDEIEEVVGFERPITLHDKANLPYTHAFILEIQRMASIAPLGVPHLCSETRVVGDYTIPKDSVVLTHLDAVFADENTWGDPANFRPDRFLNAQGRVVAPEEFLPFSLGKRACLGESMAQMELFLFISRVYQRFHVQPEVQGQLPSMERNIGLTAIPQPFKPRFVERH